jgi:VWFA-related protein
MIAALLALFGLLALADPQPVIIDAVVSDARGRSVDTLKVQDFELRDDGNVLPLDEVRFVRNEPRLVAIYLDEYHVSAGPATDRARAALTAFIDRNLGPNDLIVVMKPLDSLLKIELTRDHAAARARVSAFDGRSGDYTPRNEYEREFIAGTPARIEVARTQVAWSAINALAVHLGTLGPQRKTLVLVSDTLASFDRRRGQESLPGLDAVVRAADRSNVAVYALDPDGSADVSVSEPIRRLATETDGRVIAGDLDAGLDRAIADAAGYYLLTSRTSAPDDGRFHPLQIRVKHAGVQVHARRGYFARSPDDLLRAAVLARLNAPRPVTPPEPPAHASPLIQPWFGWARGNAGKTRVTFVWEPAARVPGDRSRRIAARLTFTALTADGALIFEGSVAPTGVGTIEEPGAISSRAVFDAPPGRIKLRMTIEDAASQVIDRDVRDIVVRDLRGEVAIGTPQVMRARNARELRTLDEQAAVPVVSRAFSRAEQLLVRVPVYGRTGTPRVSARLLNRAGQEMRELSIASPGPDGVEAFSVPLAGLAVGDYAIEVKATDAAGEAKDRIAFRVTP